jgi:hypothetical protein
VIREFCSEDCVPLGSDGVPGFPEAIIGSDFYTVLEAELHSCGYSEKRIEKIFNGKLFKGA